MHNALVHHAYYCAYSTPIAALFRQGVILLMYIRGSFTRCWSDDYKRARFFKQ